MHSGDRLSQITQELKRREREERLRYFKPMKPPQNDQAGFLRSPAKIRAVFGGNRSGKTEIGVVDCLMMALGVHPVRSESAPPPVYLRYCAPKWEDNIKAVIVKKFQAMTPRKDIKGDDWPKAWSEKSRTLSFKNGSKVRFFTYEQDVNVYGGDDIDGFYMDEHGEEKYFIENNMRTLDRNGYGVLTMTPEAGITWEEDNIILASENDPNIDYWRFTTFDNPYLSQEAIKEVEKLITDERLRDAKLRGLFVALSGLVYPQFDRARHVIPDRPFPNKGLRQCIIDPHLRKPTAIIWRYVDPDGVSYVYREAEFAPTEGGVKELAEFIRIKSGADHIDQWIADEAMGGDALNIHGVESVIVQLNKYGLPFVGTNQDSNKDFAAGVNKVRQKLNPDQVTGKPTHYIFKSCYKIAKQYQRYQFRKETRVDEELLREHVRNIDDDLVTCDRYGMMAEIKGGKGKVTSGIAGNW